MKIAFAFAGQGSQYVGMGQSLYQSNPAAKNLYDSLETDFDIKKLCFEGPKEELNHTAFAQPCILVTSLAIAEALKSEGIVPEYVCGLSLGEYSALTYASVFEYDDAVKIISERGRIMAEALPAGTTGMAAVMGASPEKIEETLTQVTKGFCTIANYNSPAQIVITGETPALEEAIELLKAQKAKCIKLNVSGAFHCSLLEDASVKLSELLSDYTLSEPTIPVVYNVTGTEKARDVNIKELLVQQIKSPVRFIQSVEYMIEQGVDTFVEIGPGKALSGFIKKIDPNVTVIHVEDEATLNNALEVLKK